MKKTLGVIGGMGPLATVKLFEKIVLLTDAQSDQEHLHIIIDNNTLITDRSAYILVGGEDPRSELISSAKKLQDMGADFLIMPCNTAHYFYDEIVDNIEIPFLNMIEETAKYILEHQVGIKNIGLLATEGTYNTKVYDKIFSKYGINIISPSVEKRAYIMELIYNIKKGIHHQNLEHYYDALDELKNQKVDYFIIGCTELSVALHLYNLEGNYIDALDVIAKKAIKFSGAKLKNE